MMEEGVTVRGGSGEGRCDYTGTAEKNFFWGGDGTVLCPRCGGGSMNLDLC